LWLLFLHVAFAMSVLEAVLANVLEPHAVSAPLIIGMTLNVFESVNC
jgi:hypothetical protein